MYRFLDGINNYLFFCREQHKLDEKTIRKYKMDLEQNNCSITKWQKKMIVRDIAVIELLFATGLRISELCNLKVALVNLENGVLFS